MSCCITLCRRPLTTTLTRRTGVQKREPRKGQLNSSQPEISVVKLAIYFVLSGQHTEVFAHITSPVGSGIPIPESIPGQGGYADSPPAHKLNGEKGRCILDTVTVEDKYQNEEEAGRGSVPHGQSRTFSPRADTVPYQWEGNRMGYTQAGAIESDSRCSKEFHQSSHSGGQAGMERVRWAHVYGVAVRRLYWVKRV